MKVAVVSDDFHTLSGRVGTARRFLMFEVDRGQRPRLDAYFELPVNCPTFEELRGHGASFHPLDGMIVMAREACRECREDLAQRGSKTVVTAEPDPLTAVALWAADRLSADARGWPAAREPALA